MRHLLALVCSILLSLGLATASWSQTSADASPAELLEKGIAAYDEWDHERAEELLKASLELGSGNKSAAGLSLSDQGKAWFYLGLIYEWEERWEEVADAHRRTLGIQEQTLGSEHENTNITALHLAYALDNLGQYAEAIELYRRVPVEQLLEKGIAASNAWDFERAEELLKASLELGSGSNSAAVLSLSDQGKAWWYLGLTYEAEERWEGAADAHKRSLSIKEQTLGWEHESTNTTAVDLASALVELGQYAEAIELYRRVLTFEQQTHGWEHEYTNLTAFTLAATLFHLGQYAEAIELYRRVPVEQLLEKGIAAYNEWDYEWAEELLKASLELGSGSNSAAGLSLSDQGKAWFYLGLTYEAEVLWEEAADAYRRTLSIDEQTLGWEHEYTNITALHLAYALTELGQYAEAIELYRRVPVEQLLERGIAAYDEWDYERAEELLKASLELGSGSNSAAGLSLSDQGNAWWHLGQTYELEELWEEAADAYRRTLSIQEQTLGSEHENTNITALHLAFALTELGQYAEAIEHYRRVPVEQLLERGIAAYDEWDYERAEELLKASLELGSGSNSAAGLSLSDQGNAWWHLGQTYYDQSYYELEERWEEAADAYRRTLSIQEQTLGSEHENTNITAFYLAFALTELGQYAEAIELYRRVPVEQLLERGIAAYTVRRLANVLDELGQYAEAVELYRRVLAFEEQTLGWEDEDTNLTAFYLTMALDELGQYAEAEALEQKKLEARERVLGPEHPETLSSLNYLAVFLMKQGQYAEAEALNRKALEIYERVLDPEHPDTLSSLNNLAVALLYQGQYAESEALHRKALEARERVLGPEHPETLSSLNNLAVSLSPQGQYAEAEALRRKLLEIEERVLGPEHPGTLSSLNNLAVSLSDQGQEAEAEAMYRKVLKAREGILGPEHLNTLTSLNNLANSLGRQDQYAAAEALHRKALETRERVLGPKHPATLSSLSNLAETLLSLEQPSEALIYARRVTDAGEALRWTHLPSLWLVEEETGEALIGESFEVVQATQSSSAGEAISQLGARMASGTGELSELVRQEQDLGNQVAAYDKAVLEALSEPGDTPGIEAKKTNLRSRLEELKEQLAATQAELDERFPDYANLVRPQPVVLSEIQELLSTEEALVVLDAEPDEANYLWVVTRDRAEWVSWELPGGFWNVIDGLRGVVELKPNTAGQLLLKPFNEGKRNDAWTVYQKTLGRLEELIADKPDLVFVLSGPLSTIPPSMLITQKPVSGEQPSYLIDRHNITIMPSVTSLKILRTNDTIAQAVNPLVGFADPQYDPTGEWENTSGDGEGGSRTLRTTRDLYENGKMDLEKLWSQPRLPDTADEIQAVRAILEGSEDDIYLGPAATETQIKQLSDLHDFDVVYLATHGLLASESQKELGFNPEPGLLMAGPEEATELDDGLLTASEAALLDLNANWVVLSACNTARGDGRGEALSGLARAFFYAGAQSLVVSHWAVDSEATVPLMVEMFEAYSEGSTELSGAEALRQSMLAMKAQEEYRHPHFWAPFVLVGEPQ